MAARVATLPPFAILSSSSPIPSEPGSSYFPTVQLMNANRLGRDPFVNRPASLFRNTCSSASTSSAPCPM